jgi:hypothetical protein
VLTVVVVPRYQALPDCAPTPAGPACIETAELLKPLPPRMGPAYFWRRSSTISFEGTPPTPEMATTSGLLPMMLVA